MEIKTFDTIVTEICNAFDLFTSPKKILRTNTNIIYLIFKALSKGFEVINNVCVSLSNKFIPAYCSDEDLVSTAYLVGTEKKKGSVSGLRVVVQNTSSQASVLPSGTYSYAFTDDVSFKCTVENDISIPGEDSIDLIFLTEKLGRFEVTMQQSIAITSDSDIPDAFNFSCSANTTLLGYTDETNLEFRQRLLTDTDRQDVINELSLKLRNLPYVFDCAIFFNRNTSVVNYGDFEVPPYYMLVMLSTAFYNDEIAKIIAESAIYPTVNVEDESHELKYVNSVFSEGYYPVYVNDFRKKKFVPYITYRIDTNYISDNMTRQKIRNGLITAINNNVHKDAITSDEIFNVIKDLNISGVTLYGVRLKVNNIEVDYVNCNKTEIAEIDEIEWNPVFTA